MWRTLPAATVLALVLAAPAAAHLEHSANAARMAAPVDQPCPGAPIEADRVITGSFGTELQGSYVMVPFTVPDGTTAVRVKYCYEDTDSPLQSQADHTIDLGLYDARQGATWGPAEFRGWGGSSHADVTVSPEGFSPEEQYRSAPRAHVPGFTTRGFKPGPIPDGLWAAELGVAAVVGPELLDSDGKVGWRVEIDTSNDPAFADQPYQPATYDETPARAEAGWYQGDLHVHAEHSSLGDATMTEVFEYGFGTAKLDFITLSDYVTNSGWGEIGRYQGKWPGRLVTRSSEVITYRGHTNNQTSGRYVDHRTGPVYELKPDGSLGQIRGARPASAIFDDVLDGGGFTQVNHPTIFPSEVPGFALQCRGCPWDYSDEETQWPKVHAYEIATGPGGLEAGAGLGFNPFTLTAVLEYERLLAAGHHIAAVGVSDSHQAGRRNNPITQAPIGQATTVVRADELSEAGIRCGVKAGHTFVKIWSPSRPDLRLEATAPGLQGTAIMGDTIRASGVQLTAKVLGGAPEGGLEPYILTVMRDGLPIHAEPVPDDDHTVTLSAAQPGRYGLYLLRTASFEAISTPIWVEAPGANAPAIVQRGCTAASPGALRVKLGAARVQRGAIVTTCRLVSGRARRCTVTGRVGKRVVARGTKTFRGSTARVRLKLTKTGRALLARRGRLKVRLSARVTEGAALATARRTVVVRR